MSYGEELGSRSPWGSAGDPFPTESVAPASGNPVAALTASRRGERPAASGRGGEVAHRDCRGGA